MLVKVQISPSDLPYDHVPADSWVTIWEGA